MDGYQEMTFKTSLFLSLINGKLLGLLAIMFGVGLELNIAIKTIKSDLAGRYIWLSLLLLMEGFCTLFFVLEYDQF